MLIRVLIGLLLVAMSYLVWDVVNGFFFSGESAWDIGQEAFFDIDRLRDRDQREFWIGYGNED